MTENSSAANKRRTAFDVLNIIACLGVIALHHNNLVHSYVRDSIGWIQSLVVECVCYCSVPVFMMLSGANLLGYLDRYSTGEFFKKRFIRTVIPWLCWSVIFLFWKIAAGDIKDESLTVLEKIQLITTYKVESVYWFFGELFACYLAMPVLSALRNQRRMLMYFAGINFIFLSVYPYVQNWLGLAWSIQVPIVGSLIIFVVLGYLLSTTQLSKRDRMILYAAGAICLLFRFFYTLYFSRLSGKTDVSIKAYVSFHSVFYACAFFALMLNIPWDSILPSWLKKRLPAISDCSFGIFLIHRMVMKYESAALGIGKGDWAWRILCIPLTYFVCLLLTAGIKRIPVLRRLMG